MADATMRQLMVAGASLLVVGTFALGCSSEDDTKKEPPPETNACQTDDACPDGYYCYVEPGAPSGVCTTGCRLDPDDCPEGYTCNQTTHVCDLVPVRCTADTDCEDGHWCDVGSGECLEGCRISERDECQDPEATQFCNQDHQLEDCPPICQQDTDCDAGYWCDTTVPRGSCRQGCRGPEDCPSEKPLCIDHKCKVCTDCPEPCNDDSPDPADRCPGGYFCHPGTQLCTPTCNNDSDCDEGEVCCVEEEICEFRTCVPRCQTEGIYACPQGWTCNEHTGHCMEGMCNVDSDCPRDCLICEDHTCRPGCRDDSCCGDGQYCDTDPDQLRCMDGCKGDEDCEAWEICDDLHQCRNRPCLSDADCPTEPDLFYCDTQTNSCERGQCRSTADCDPGYFCDDEHRCRQGCTPENEAERCGEDEVCDAESRRCVPGCRPDELEPNDAAGSAVAIELDQDRSYDRSGLKICEGDEDWFTITLEPGESLELTVQYDTLQGDLGVELLDPGLGVLERSANPGQARQTVRIQMGDEGTALFVRVWGQALAGPVGLRYRLLAQVTGVSPCPADDAEPNDVWNHATPLEDGLHEGLTMCTNDDDWYSFQLGVGDELFATITTDDPATPVRADLYMEGELEPTFLVFGDISQDDPSITTVHMPQVFTSGTYYLEVYPAMQGQPVSVGYTLSLEPVRFAQCQDDRFEDNDTRMTATPLEGLLYDQLYEDLALCTEDEDWYSVEVQTGDSIRVELVTPEGQEDGNLDLELYRGGVVIQRSATPNPVERLLVNDLDGDVYYIRVVGRQETSHSTYTMRVQVRLEQCVDDFWDLRGDGSMDEAVEVSCGDVVQGLATCFEDDDYFVVQTFSYGGVTGRIDFPLVAGELDLEILAEDGEILAERGVGAGDSKVAQAHGLEPGFYYFHVYALAGRPNRYSFSVECNREERACTPDTREPNDTADTAYPVFLNRMLPDPWTMGDTLLCTDLKNFRSNWDDCAQQLPQVCDGQGIPEDCQADFPCYETPDGERNPDFPPSCAWLMAIRQNYGFCTPDAVDEWIHGEGGCLRICEDDEDWFQFQVRAGDQVDILCRFMHFAGDLGLDLYCFGDWEIPVASSDGSADDEHILYIVPQGQQGTCRVRVHGTPQQESGAEYSLDIEPLCTADTYEPNNEDASATRVVLPAPGDPAVYENGGRVCGPRDADWFKFTATGHTHLEIQAYFDDGDGALGMLLDCGDSFQFPVDEDGNPTDVWPLVSQENEDGELLTVDLPGEGPGECTLKVTGLPGRGGGLVYDLGFTVADIPE